MQNNTKRHLIIIARTSEQDDMAFYKTVLRHDSPLFNKAIVHMFSTVSQVVDFISSMPPDFSFSVLIHVGNRTLTKGQDAEEISKEIKKQGSIQKLKYEYTSRDGDDVLHGITVHHTQKLPDDFDINSLPLNTVSELLPSPIPIDKDSVAIPRLDFAILTALDEFENDIFRENMSYRKIDLQTNRGSFAPNVSFSADYKNEFILAKQKEMGLVDSAFSSCKIHYLYQPKFLIMSGVCGGRKSKVKMFDIIIPKKVYDFTFGSLEKGEFLPRDLDSKINDKIIEYLNTKENKKRIKDGMTLLADPKLSQWNEYVNNATIHFDVMASGPWVLKTTDYLETLANKTNDLIRGLEMESYSIGRAHEIFKDEHLNTLVVKSVMDFTDDKKGDEFNGVPVKKVAGYISYLCVRAIMPMLIEFENEHVKPK